MKDTFLPIAVEPNNRSRNCMAISSKIKLSFIAFQTYILEVYTYLNVRIVFVEKKFGDLLFSSL